MPRKRSNSTERIARSYLETINQLKKDHKKPAQILINRYNKIIKDVPKERLNHIKKKIKFQGLGFFV